MFLKACWKATKKVAGKVASAAVSLAPVAALAAQDYSGVSTALNAEIAAAMPVALGLFGTVAAIYLGFRLIKKGTKG